MGFVPHEQDPHWSIIVPLTDVPVGVRNAALQANYAGDPYSHRHEFGRIKGEEAFRQHCRAAVNVTQIPTLREAFASAQQPDAPLTWHLNQTRRVNGVLNVKGITPCPEAVHQVRMFDDAGLYIGRVGFNIHLEAETPIVTIANIQGVPGKGPAYDHLRRQTGSDPFVDTLQFARETMQSVLPDPDFRAVIPSKATRPDFYKRIFRCSGNPHC